jgi:hypothetical protein
MTVYVDDARIPARAGRITGVWSHLFTDADPRELHDFAARIGLRRAWFQDRSGHGIDRSHYDVTDTLRRRALAAGAHPVSWRETPHILRTAHHARGGHRP